MLYSCEVDIGSMQGHRVRRLIFAAMLTCWGSAAFAAATDMELVNAVRSNDVDAVQSLLNDGVDVNATTSDGATVLQWAVHNDQAALVELLLEAGADAGISNRYGVSAASLAAENGNAAIL